MAYAPIVLMLTLFDVVIFSRCCKAFRQSSVRNYNNVLWKEATPVLGYIAKRILRSIPVLIIVALVSFIVTHVMPGDPVRMILGNYATKAQVLQLQQQLGLDKPLYAQFAIWLAQLLRGDLGESLFWYMPVTTAILTRIGPTLMLAAIGQTIGILIGIPLGIFAALKHKTLADQFSIAVSLVGISVPSFWVALMLILLFGVKLRWLPVCGYRPFSEVGMGVFRYLALPGITLGLMQSGLIARMTRSAMLDVLRQDYIRTARSKGLPETIVVLKHALKNAMPPIITVIGFSLATLLGGTWVVETVFNIPGTGSMAINAIMRRDYPLIQGCMIFIALIYVMVNLLVDVIYALINPRVRY